MGLGLVLVLGLAAAAAGFVTRAMPTLGGFDTRKAMVVGGLLLAALVPGIGALVGAGLATGGAFALGQQGFSFGPPVMTPPQFAAPPPQAMFAR